MSWEVFAIKYAERNARTRADSFLFDDNHEAPHEMDYYVWVLRRNGRVILVDTGYDHAEAEARGRPIAMDPRDALAPLGLVPESVETVIVTHLHYDHAGGLALFPNATLHIQSAEMAYATGPCMCHDTLRAPFTADHICEAIRRLYQGRVIFHDGSAEIAEGVVVHRIGGHSRGLQCVSVETSIGTMVLASDAAHYYENALREKPFPIVVDLEDMLTGFRTLRRLASHDRLIVPGHDPLVRRLYPAHERAEWIRVLHPGPQDELPPF